MYDPEYGVAGEGNGKASSGKPVIYLLRNFSD